MATLILLPASEFGFAKDYAEAPIQDASATNNRGDSPLEQLEESEGDQVSVPSLCQEDEVELQPARNEVYAAAVDDGDDGDSEHCVIRDEDHLDVAMMEPTTPLLEEASSPLAMDEEADVPISITYSTDPGSDTDFGGLLNLGNTCYMASALQMVASLESFVDELKTNVEEIPTDSQLQRCLVDLFDQLARGKSVRPVVLKDTVDTRSSLFVGYDQQDAHEFLTTLLGMLDDEYNIKTKTTRKVNENLVSYVNTPNDAMDEDNDGEMDETEPVDMNLSLTVNVPKGSALVPHSVDTIDPPSLLYSRHAFSELDVDEIRHLLHGTPTSREGMLLPAYTAATEPRCKLVGGRMHTTDIPWTSYESHSFVGNQMKDNECLNSHHSPLHASTAATSTADDADHLTADDDKVVSPVNDFFTTVARARLTCDSCMYTRTHLETYLHLSLEIGNDVTVEDSLRRFFAPEPRELKCEKCFCERATQTTEIVKLPRALLLHFKRFIVDVSDDWASVSYRKNQSAVVFEDTLSLDKDMGVLSEFLATDYSLPTTSGTSCSLGNRYGIRSVVNHIGASASCGHYTADAYRRKDETRKWMRFNDAFVSSISEKQALLDSQKTAYMVLYELE
jgi:ubiquitin C-terminal hydrolase